jgi:riboflavin kinase/FMN adenylyltransferase
MFDGIHLGHKFILKQLKKTASRLKIPSLVITFDKHPRAVLGKPFDGYISSNEQKKELLLERGINQVWFLKTTPELLKLSGEEFVSCLARQIDIKELIVGEDFCFGYGRHNGVGDLKKFSLQHDFNLKVIKKKKISGITASSSLVRQAVLNADFKTAGKILGRPYSFIGRVEKGKGVGTKLGFSTANIYPREMIVPCDGVYAAAVKLSGKKFVAAVNIGHLHGATGERVVEAHIIVFKKNIVGETLEIIFLKQIRKEKKFSSIQALQEAIAKDVKMINNLKFEI